MPPNYLTADGRSIPAPYWFAKAGVGAKVTPPASLGTMLFDPANSERGTLGLNLYPFLSPRVFGTIHQGNDTAKRCDLFRTGPTRSGTPIDASVGVPTVLSTNVTSLSGAAGQGDVRRGWRSPAGVRGPAGPRWLRPLRHDVHHGGRAPVGDRGSTFSACADRRRQQQWDSIEPLTTSFGFEEVQRAGEVGE